MNRRLTSILLSAFLLAAGCSYLVYRLVVSRLAGDSPAQSLGVQPGDVIWSIDQKPATTPEEAASQLTQAAARGDVLLLLNRHGVSQFVGLSVENSDMSGSSRPR